MTKLRKECREMARVEGNLRKTMEKAGFGDIARDLGLGDSLAEGPLVRYALLDRFMAAILASQNSVHLDPAQAAEFAGRRALAMLAWIDEHEAEIDAAVMAPEQK